MGSINIKAKNLYKIVEENYITKVGGTLTKTAEEINIYTTEGNIDMYSNTSINIKAKDGIILGEYQEPPEKEEQLITNFITVVQFYRSSEQEKGDYGIKDTTYKGAFGFDKFDTKIHAEGLVQHYTKFNITTLSKDIIKEKPHLQYIPYLSIWPPGNPAGAPSTVTLYLKAEEATILKDIKGRIKLQSSNPNIVVPTAFIEIEIGGALVPITIQCKSTFSSPVTVSAVLDGDPSKKVGQLMVYPNDIRYKTIIQPILVNIESDSNRKVATQSDFSKYNIDIKQLVKDFNERSFNQAYIYGELAPDLYQFGIGKHHISDYIKNVQGEDILVFENAYEYNRILEERYGAAQESTQKQTDVTIKENKERELKQKIKKVLEVFDKHYNFKGGSLKFTEKKRKEKIASTAWDTTKKSPEYQDYLKILNEYNNVTKAGAAVSINKTHTLHVFITPKIYAAASKENIANYSGTSIRDHFPVILAYADRSSGGISHIFKSTTEQKKTSKLTATYIINSTILHEMGHSLSLEHTFDLEDVPQREVGITYKEDIEKEIELIETKDKGKIDKLEEEIKKLKEEEKISTKENIPLHEVASLTKLKEYYNRLEKYKEDYDRINSNTIKIVEEITEKGAKPIENQLGGHANTRTVAQVESELQQAKTKLENLKKQRKTAPKLPTQEQKKEQSKTLENYLDYNNPKGSREVVEDMERKVFYKWQWDAMRQFGASNNFLEPLP